METFNRDDGFIEGLLRGYRSTFLSDGTYSNLKEGGQRGASDKAREDFEDLRLALQESDYGNFLAAEGALDPKIIAARATAKWVKEFKYFRASATGALARFLDFVTYEFIIDNILDLVKAATSSTTVDLAAVIENCHPLGLLEPAVMKSILAFEDLGEDFPALYRAILVDTPVGHYFTQFMQDIADEKAASDPDSVRSTFSDIPMTIIENSIKKLYLEDFNHFCRNVIGGDTGAIMGELLDTRADMLTINITYNRLARRRQRPPRPCPCPCQPAAHTILYPAFFFFRQLVDGLFAHGRQRLAHLARLAVSLLWPALPRGVGLARSRRGRGGH